jgi:dipeptidyl aminopeptidase/acylaminoacyl peptidase
MKTTGLLVLAIALLVAAAPARADGRRITLHDLARIARVTDPQISPDGRSVAVVVARPDYDEDRWQPELVLVDVPSGAQRALTHERRGVDHPRWSPSGDRLAFLATAGAGKEEQAQIFVMPMNGGDTLRITSAPRGVQQFTWSPDGRQIAYVTADEPRKAGKYDDAFEVGDHEILVTAAQAPSHVWRVSADGTGARRLTSGTGGLPTRRPPGPPAHPLSWSPDGKTIVVTRRETPYGGDVDASAIQLVDVASGSVRPLTGGRLFEGFAAFSPDGARIAYAFPGDGDRRNGTEVHVAPATGGSGASVSHALDRNVARAIWMPDGKSLLVGAHDGTGVSLWVQPLAGPARRLDLTPVVPSWSFWIDASVSLGGEIAFAGAEPRRPAEIYVMASADGRPRRLTDINGEVAGLDLGKVERFEWQGPDGFKEDGVVTYPPDFAAGRSYPLVLLVHGGPRAASVESFSALAQLMAARGWVVFEPNYRGSDNLGNAYQRAIYNDAGDGPGRDVMAGMEALKARGFADPTRVAVSGWSYGGYMTTWLIGHYDGWRAAVAGAPVTDWVDQYNLADGNVQVRYIFGGSPWTGDFMKAYLAQSPISYSGKIKTPTLILANTGDARVIPTQAYKLFHALKDNGVVTRFFAYPIPGHNAADPVRARDTWRRWLEWLADYLK